MAQEVMFCGLSGLCCFLKTLFDNAIAAELLVVVHSNLAAGVYRRITSI